MSYCCTGAEEGESDGRGDGEGRGEAEESGAWRAHLTIQNKEALRPRSNPEASGPSKRD